MFVEKLFETFGLGRVFADRSFLFDIPTNLHVLFEKYEKKGKERKFGPQKKLSGETLS